MMQRLVGLRKFKGFYIKFVQRGIKYNIYIIFQEEIFTVRIVSTKAGTLETSTCTHKDQPTCGPFLLYMNNTIQNENFSSISECFRPMLSPFLLLPIHICIYRSCNNSINKEKVRSKSNTCSKTIAFKNMEPTICPIV